MIAGGDCSMDCRDRSRILRESLACDTTRTVLVRRRREDSRPDVMVRETGHMSTIPMHIRIEKLEGFA